MSMSEVELQACGGNQQNCVVVGDQNMGVIELIFIEQRARERVHGQYHTKCCGKKWEDTEDAVFTVSRENRLDCIIDTCLVLAFGFYVWKEGLVFSQSC